MRCKDLNNFSRLTSQEICVQKVWTGRTARTGQTGFGAPVVDSVQRRICQTGPYDQHPSKADSHDLLEHLASPIGLCRCLGLRQHRDSSIASCHLQPHTGSIRFDLLQLPVGSKDSCPQSLVLADSLQCLAGSTGTCLLVSSGSGRIGRLDGSSWSQARGLSRNQFSPELELFRKGDKWIRRHGNLWLTVSFMVLDKHQRSLIVVSRHRFYKNYPHNFCRKVLFSTEITFCKILRVPLISLKIDHAGAKTLMAKRGCCKKSTHAWVWIIPTAHF